MPELFVCLYFIFRVLIGGGSRVLGSVINRGWVGLG